MFADSCQTAPAPGTPSPDLNAELDELIKLKQQLDDLLTQLDDSPAGRAKVGDLKLNAPDVGTGFDEAGLLTRTYQDVHSQVETLSKLLGDQIEVMRVAVGGAHNDFADVDEEQRRRVWAIYQSTKAHYDPKLDPTVSQCGPQGADSGYPHTAAGRTGSYAGTGGEMG